jgi:hypothetical protein
MADLKSLLGDKYKEGMTIEEIMALEVEEPQVDMSKFVSKELYDKAASDTATYKKQLRANMSEAEQKAAADAEKLAEIIAERDQLKAEKAMAEYAKGLVAIGYDETLATEVATALHNGDADTVIKAQAKFVDAQKKLVLADAVKETPVPPAGGDGGNVVTKEKLRAMSPAERYEFSQKNPEEYKKIYNGG